MNRQKKYPLGSILKNVRYAFFVFAIIALMNGCKEDYATSDVYTLYTGTIYLNGDNVLTNNPDGVSQATAQIWVMSNNELYYDVYFTAIETGETPTTLHLFAGSLDEPAALIADLDNPAFSDTYSVQGSIVINDAQIEQLTSTDYYLLCRSTGYTNGIVAGNPSAN